MSWCRWSTVLDSGDTSDLFIYETEDNVLALHVASRRRIDQREAPPWPTISMTESEWQEGYRKRMDWLKAHQDFETIGLPYDGQSFYISDDDEMRAMLIKLRDLGYRFPDSVFDRLDAYTAAAGVLI